MIREAIDILRADGQLLSLIDGNPANYHIYPLNTSYTGDCILYDGMTIAEDKLTATIRLQLTIIADTTAKTLEIEQRVKHLLLTFGDEPLTSNILKVEVNGGGTMYDDARQKHHRILYLQLKTRSEK